MFVLHGSMGQKGRLIQNADRCGIKKSVFHPCRSVAIFWVAAAAALGLPCPPRIPCPTLLLDQ